MAKSAFIFQMRLFLLVLISVAISGCVKKLFLKKSNTYLLTRQVVKGNKSIPTDQLEPLFSQKENRKVAGTMPYLWIYLVGQSFYNQAKAKKDYEAYQAIFDAAQLDTPMTEKKQNHLLKMEKILDRKLIKATQGNWVMRKLGEPPTIYDSALTKRTNAEIKAWYHNKGYFDATVNTEVDTNIQGNLRIVYRISEGSPQRIGKYEYNITDEKIRELLDSTRKEALIDSGDIYDETLITAERERLDKLLRNNGFYLFNRNYITIAVDTGSVKKKLVNVFVRVLDQPNGLPHKQYMVSEMNFNLDDGSNRWIEHYKYNKVTYTTQKRHLNFRTLDSKIQIKPGQLFNIDKIMATQGQIGAMDMFQLVRYNIDTSYFEKADSTLPQELKKRKFILNYSANFLPSFTLSDELGLIVSAGAPGPFGNIGFKVRNALGGFEIFEINGRGSIEGVFSNFTDQNTVFRASELGLNTALTFPVITLPFGLGNKLNYFNPKTRILLGYTTVSRPEYNRNIINATYTWTIQPIQNNTFGFSPLDWSINFTPRLNDRFSKYLDSLYLRGNPLRQSFNSSLVTGVSGYYMYNSNQIGSAVHKKSHYFRVNYELGGFIPGWYSNNYLNGSDNLGGLKIYRYFRLNLDYRYYTPVRKGTGLATRVHLGLSNPYGRSSTLPYEKFYFIGGSNGLRGWSPRRLGPGSFGDRNTDGTINYVFEQPGNLIFETGLEIRQKLIGFLEGALFTDIGNIWRTKEDETRPGSLFDPKTAISELAVDVGYGFRFDFTFLVLRFDIATKAYEPGRISGDRAVLKNITWRKPFGAANQTLVNIGVGYPF